MMAKKKSSRKNISKSTRRTTQSRVISFFIGVATVAAITFLIFQYAQNNNYKTVLGEHTQILKQNPR